MEHDEPESKHPETTPEVWSLATREDWDNMTAEYEALLEPDLPTERAAKRVCRANSRPKTTREDLLKSFRQLGAGAGTDDPVDISLCVVQVLQSEILGGCRDYWFTLRTLPLIVEKLLGMVEEGTMVYDLGRQSVYDHVQPCSR